MFRGPFRSFLLLALAAGFSPVFSATEFQETVEPFLQKNCVACHSQASKTAGVALDHPDQAAAVMDAFIWEDVKNVLLRGQMPPTGMPRPDAAELEKVVSWIDSQMEAIEANAKPDPGRVTARRLNRTEYNHTVQDLLHVDLRPADEFPVDDSGYGFDNIGDVLTLSPVLMEKYLDAAGELARTAIVTDREPPSATVERYQQSRAEDGAAEVQAVGTLVEFTESGRLTVEHEFPATGEYAFEVNDGDRRPWDRTGMGLLPPSQMLGLFIDGELVDAMPVSPDPDKYGPSFINVRLRIPAGAHDVTAQFYDSERGPFNPNVDFERRLLWADYVEIQGPFDAEPPPLPESHKRLVTCSPDAPAEQDRCAQRILGELARNAYRRPVTPREVDDLVRFVKLARAEGASFEEGLQVAVQAILVSPKFLFRIEQNPAGGAPGGFTRLSDFEIASRLSYFLWSSMPDEALLRAAGAGKLSTDDGVAEQALRLLADPKADAFVENFAGQWLQLRNLDRVVPDPELFPQFDESLRKAMRKETELFFGSLMREDRSILDFLDAKYTFLNERLAKHYGIPGVHGTEFRRVELEGEERGGILGQASVLTVSSYPTRTSPVLRGIWVLENVLNSPPPPPPPGVPELEETEIGPNMTLRAQLEAHRADPACGVCHNRIDPLGFGLENYDPIGRWREIDGRSPVDASGELPGGLRFESPAELKNILRETEGDRFVRALTEKMLIYALGRGLDRSDTPVVKDIQRRLGENGYRFSSLVTGVATSAPFLMRSAEEVSSDD